jgi:glucose/arabinose dehydrogenase
LFSRLIKLSSASVAAFGLFTAVAGAAGPPPPTATNGHAVEQVAAGLTTPTSFAFGAGKVFEGDGGSEQPPKAPGGVFLLSHGAGTRLAGSPPFVAGLAWRKGTLYVSAGSKLLAWSKWNGTKFAKRKTIYKAPNGFTGFNGIAFGANGRLYAGVSLAPTNDHSPSKAPYAFDVLSFTAAGKDLKVEATGMRQPWQMVFPKGSNSPFVSDLGQDVPAKTPPDFIYRIKRGSAAGFPACNWIKPKPCKGFLKPYKMFAPHTSAMGLGIIGKQLFISEFGLQQVVSTPVAGGAVTPLLTGFVAPIVGLATHGGWVYVGELTGQVFRVTP